MKTELYVVVVLPPDDEPYVFPYCDFTSSSDAYQAAAEAHYETGCKAVVKTIRLHPHDHPQEMCISADGKW